MSNLWLDLLNSDWQDHRGSGRKEDRLINDKWLKQFLHPWQSSLKGFAIENIRENLQQLRTLIKQMAVKFSAGKSIAKKDMDIFNQILGKSAKVIKIKKKDKGFVLTHEYAAPGISSLLSEIAESFAVVMANGQPERIKMCSNPDCKWIFYDRSKNKSRKWCGGTDSCGNMIKVRRFRARKRRLS